MCQLALDMFGRTLAERNIPYQFRFTNIAREFHKKCGSCELAPYLPLDGDLTLNGLCWNLSDDQTERRTVHDFSPICLRCALESDANIGFWIPTRLTPQALGYVMFDGECLGADSIDVSAHPSYVEDLANADPGA